jgi:hypothetical protein
MNTPSLFTGDLQKDWKRLCELWRESRTVFGSEVGPMWEMSPQHKACIEFAECYPDSKDFLIQKLSEPDAVIAAYAFKCLIRVADIRVTEIPESVLSRQDPITTHFRSWKENKSLADFMAEYFKRCPSREELLKAQEHSLRWQRNELADYKKAKKKERDLS